MPAWIDRLTTYALARLREPSTWRGIAVTLTALGLALDPAQWQAITTIGLAVAGMIGVAMPDQPGTGLPPRPADPDPEPRP